MEYSDQPQPNFGSTDMCYSHHSRQQTPPRPSATQTRADTEREERQETERERRYRGRARGVDYYDDSTEVDFDTEAVATSPHHRDEAERSKPKERAGDRSKERSNEHPVASKGKDTSSVTPKARKTRGPAAKKDSTSTTAHRLPPPTGRRDKPGTDGTGLEVDGAGPTPP